MRNKSKMEKVLAKSIVLGLTVGMFATMANMNVASADTALGGGTAGTNAIAIGSTNIAHPTNATGESSIAMGSDADATAQDAIAIGTESSATGMDSVAIGNLASTNGQYQISLGHRATSTGSNATSIGEEAAASGDYSLAIGNAAKASQQSSIGVGTGANAAGLSAVAMGLNASATDQFTIAIGGTAKATQTGAIAYGYNAQANGANSVAMGINSTTSAQFATAVGAGAAADLSGGIAYGYQAHAKGANNVALGINTVTDGESTIAIGSDAQALGAGTALGAHAKANAYGSVALGLNAEAANANSVAIGSASQTGAAHTGTTATTYSYTLAGTAAGGTYAGAASDAKGTVSIGAAGAERQLQNVAAGDISATSTDAVNGSQLYQTNQAVQAVANKIGSVTTTANGVSNTNTVGQNIDALNNAIGTTTTGNYVTNTNSVGQNLNALDTQVKTNADNIATNTTNITNIQTALSNGYTFGADDANDSVAVGKTLLVKGDGNNITTSFTKDATSGNAVIKVTMSDNPEFDSLKIDGNTYIDSNGLNANDKKVQNVAAGDLSSTSKDAVNGSQLYQTNQNLGDINNYGSTNIVNNGDSAVDAIGKLDAATGDQNYNNVTGTGSVTDGMSTTDAIGTINNSVGDVNNYSSNNYITNGASLVDSVGALDNQVGINAANINKMGNTLGELDTRVNKVGAASAALAALHPLDFDPDDKWDFAAGYGHYKNANSAAVGAFYRPDEDTMFSIGTTFGSENMINAGVSLKVGRGNHISTSRVAMAKELVDLRNQVKELTALVKGGMGSGAGLTAQTAQFPDVPENHWAYDMVSKLAGNGIVTGYPDGSYKGDRSMTRYEMAAMIYRAMSKGAQVDGKLLNEFKPELERIRVDGKKIQRVHVVK